MKETIHFHDYAGRITEALGRGGILFNTQADGRFNTMVIGWGGLGRLWNRPTFTVYVREGRFTRHLLDASGEFTVSIPAGAADPKISKVCGFLSGRNVDKVKEAGLTLEEGRTIATPGVREYPITLECRVLYANLQDIGKLPEDIREQMYPQDKDSSEPMANRDAHIEYVGEIVDAYIIR